jgi:hypothetical protein
MLLVQMKKTFEVNADNLVIGANKNKGVAMEDVK